ncbi:uncharacterized protein BXZ73DRAFT_105991 [Epithele typhae]|uniref:uncharacterized protein n=1 Tax=Epithele typhae TaxID=378194 RepID=UPI0020077A68|nr:uncharacterized protein BXZ73DRAFT_105991 [Epithele typhae]KAH9915925.1 hypothetical protein BXZ73DRAFT_105991 [Epithele typhae]
MAQHDAHTLPAEIIFMISAAASTNDLRTATKLCLVCHATRGWVLPVMYGSVVLTTARDIETLAAALTRLTTDAPTLEHPASRIRRLWIGPTWTPSPQKAHPSESSSLQTLSSHTAWPSPSIRAILSLATNLDALAVLAAPSSFSLATLSVPKTVRALTLGPAHGPLNLNRFPHIRSVTSVNTMVFEDELRAILFGDRRSAARRRVRMVVSCLQKAIADNGFNNVLVVSRTTMPQVRGNAPLTVVINVRPPYST